MNVLKRLRYDANLTRAQLAERSGVSADTIRLIEIGSVEPRPDTANKLAKVLKVKASDLLPDHAPSNGKAAA